jgi:hypothetical protein
MGELREAFCEAVKLYCENDWSPAVPELPEVTIGKKHYPIRAVFEFATELGDALPDEGKSCHNQSEMRIIDEKLFSRTNRDAGRRPSY